MNQCIVRVVSTNIDFDAERLRPMFDSLENPLAVALALNLRRYRERRQFGGAGFRIRIQRGAAENDSVVLDDGIGGDVAFDFRAAALDERAVALERLDQLQDTPPTSSDVASRRLSSFSSTTMVPMPSCVKTSISSAPSTANGRMCERSTPPWQALTQCCR